MNTHNTHFVNLSFSDKVILITGAGQGIGAAIAQTFACHGATVIVSDINIQNAQKVCDQITHDTEIKGLAIPMLLDVGQYENIKISLNQIVTQYKKIDVVIHNAAYFPLTAFEKITPVILERTLAINLNAAFWLLQAAQPYFIAQKKGCFLVTSSTTGPRVAYSGLAHYAASKSGLNGFIRSAALEMAEYNITVNGVEPGMIATDAAHNLGDFNHTMNMTNMIPLKRLGTPQDIAASMLFLASDAAAYITGQTIIVDGGALLPESGSSI